MTGMRGSRSEAEQGLAWVATRGGKKDVRKGKEKQKKGKEMEKYIPFLIDF